MADFVIRGKKAGARWLEADEAGRIERSGSLLVAGGPAVSMASETSLTVAGKLEVGDGPALFAEGEGIRVAVRDSGYVHSPYNYGVYFRNSHDFDIRNDGTLSSGLAAVFFSAATSGRIENAGLITGAIGIEAFYQWDETLTIKNAGLITGEQVAIRQTGGALHLTNTGRIAVRSDEPDAAAIIATSDDDVIVNEGRIVGWTELKGGTNAFDGSEGVQGAVIGGAGADRIYGGVRHDKLYGGSGGNDRLYGGGGDDLLTASRGGGASRIYGQSGDDTLRDDAGNDRLYGGSGRDTLIGKSGANILDGGSGRDRLFAGIGPDQLIGGSADDVFVFRSAATVGRGSTRDTIVDFEPGDDRIDLSDIGRNDAFDFVGPRAFSETPFELRYDRDRGILSGDVDGDGRADFELRLLGAPALAADDFIF